MHIRGSSYLFPREGNQLHPGYSPTNVCWSSPPAWWAAPLCAPDSCNVPALRGITCLPRRARCTARAPPARRLVRVLAPLVVVAARRRRSRARLLHARQLRRSLLLLKRRRRFRLRRRHLAFDCPAPRLHDVLHDVVGGFRTRGPVPASHQPPLGVGNLTSSFLTAAATCGHSTYL